MATLQDFRDERLRKLDRLRELGFNPYPAESHRTHTAQEVVSGFTKLKGRTATIAGRIVAIRKFGKLAFIVVKDMSGQIQFYLNEADVAERDTATGRLDISDLPLLDTGDFVEATGEIEMSKSGEISIFVKELRLLTKSLRPMPSATEGFTNKEERMRRRYIDMNVNQDVRDRFIRRSKFWQATRDFLKSRDFIEVN
jgi:lysyl-tRNA synthetase class 2